MTGKYEYGIRFLLQCTYNIGSSHFCDQNVKLFVTVLVNIKDYLMLFYASLTAFSLILGLSIIFLNKHVFTFVDKNLVKPQASHSNPTPRVGGIAILSSAFIFCYFSDGMSDWRLFLTVFPLFLVGFLDDLGFYISSRIRLLVGAICSLIGIYLYGAWLNNIDTPGLNWVLSIPIFGILFTVFAIVGLVNAINLIDGINGLASGHVMISSVAIAIIAAKVGENGISRFALIITFSTLGLFILNYPFGRLFMGDAGAYTLGFLLAWMLVLLSYRQPELSDWSLLALVLWPVSETLLALFRRKIKEVSPDQADRMHFHQLIMRSWQILSRGRISAALANPLATATILPLAAFPVLGGTMYCFDSKVSAAIVICGIFSFCILYFYLANAMRYGVKKGPSKIIKVIFQKYIFGRGL